MNSRLSTSLDKILDSFQSCNSASRYNPTKGYWWEFKNHKVDTQKKKKEEENVSKIATQFQKNRVDVLLGKLMKSHPYMYFQRTQGQEPIKVLSIKMSNPLYDYKSSVEYKRTSSQKWYRRSKRPFTKKSKIKWGLEPASAEATTNELEFISCINLYCPFYIIMSKKNCIEKFQM